MSTTTASVGEAEEAPSRRSLGGLLTSLPDLISRLIRGEIALVKAEITAKAKRAGTGIVILAAAAVVAFLLLETLVAAAVLATATVFPAWLAALLVAAALLIVTAVLALVGLRALKGSSNDSTEE